MSRLTGKEVYSLMEAYQAVYTPQELTEEQVWEGVENWVHSLLEEGHDLSDYTWEEMYESYLEEQGRPDSAAIRNQNVYTPPAQASAAQGLRDRMDGRRGSSVNPDAAKTRIPPTPKQNTMDGRYATPGTQRGNQDKYKSTSDGKMYANYNDALAANRSRNKNTITPGLPKVNQRPGSPDPTPASPAAPAPSSSPAATAPSPKPAAAKTTTPDSKIGGDPMDQFARNFPKLAAKVKPGQSGYNTINTRLNADNDRQENYDAYDLVLSHLINEGYADTQEAALAIMGNMSEDWREDILNTLDEAQKPLPRRKMENRRYNVNMKTGEAAGSDRNERIRSTLNAYKNDPEGEAAKARAKSKYKG